MRRREFLPVLSSPLISSVSAAETNHDWPQWRGPERNGLSRETGLLKSWPKNGPAKAWSIEGLGEGYGSLSIAGDRIFVQGATGGNSTLFALNRADGKVVWRVPIGSGLSQDRGSGPRGTPTFDNGQLYVLTEAGDLACVTAADGKVAWRRNILRDFRGQNPNWLISESPLVDGNKLIVSPGGRDACIVALDKETGKNIWTSKGLSDQAGYGSSIVGNIDGVRTVMNLTAEGGVGVRASDGKPLWHYPKPANGTANCATPIFKDNRVFYTSAYGTGCGLMWLSGNDGEVKSGEVYFSRDMQNHHGGVLLVNGYLYGFSASILTCMEFLTGRVAWKDRSVGKGSLTYADGMLYLLSENQTAGLAEATPQGYVERGRFSIEDMGWPSWAHPVVAGGKLYIRNQGRLTAYNIKS